MKILLIRKISWKYKRIKKYKIKVDELTGTNLKTQTAEFSHIRSVAIYPDSQLELDNGLIVNKKKLWNNNRKKEYKMKMIYTLCV